MKVIIVEDKKSIGMEVVPENDSDQIFMRFLAQLLKENARLGGNAHQMSQAFKDLAESGPDYHAPTRGMLARIKQRLGGD
jgi:hypothetical protein